MAPLATPPRRADAVRTVTAAGRTLRVSVRAGTGSAPPLLLCNGIGARLEVLQPFVDALDPRRTVIRFDVPGVGGSPRPRLPYRLSTLPPALVGMLGQLGHDGPVDVLGISWGGGLAQHFAVQHRTRCRRLVLAATGTGSLMVPGHPRALAHMLTPLRHRDPGSARRVAGELYGGTMRTHPSGRRWSCRPAADLGRGWATTTSWRPRPVGPACRSSPSSGSRPW